MSSLSLVSKAQFQSFVDEFASTNPRQRVLVVEFVAATCLACHRVKDGVKQLRRNFEHDAVAWHSFDVTDTDLFVLTDCELTHLPCFALFSGRQKLCSFTGTTLHSLQDLINDAVLFAASRNVDDSTTTTTTTTTLAEPEDIQITFDWLPERPRSKALLHETVYESCFALSSLRPSLQTSLRARAPPDARFVVLGGARVMTTLSGYDESERALLAELSVVEHGANNNNTNNNINNNINSDDDAADDDDDDDDEYEDVDDSELSWTESLLRCRIAGGDASIALALAPELRVALNDATAVLCVSNATHLLAVVIGAHNVVVAALEDSLEWFVVQLLLNAHSTYYAAHTGA